MTIQGQQGFKAPSLCGLYNPIGDPCHIGNNSLQIPIDIYRSNIVKVVRKRYKLATPNTDPQSKRKEGHVRGHLYLFFVPSVTRKEGSKVFDRRKFHNCCNRDPPLLQGVENGKYWSQGRFPVVT